MPVFLVDRPLRGGSRYVKLHHVLCILLGAVLGYKGWMMNSSPSQMTGFLLDRGVFALGVGLLVYGLLGLFRRKSDDGQ